MKKFALAIVPAVFALAACGSTEDASVDAEADTVEMPADEALEPVAEEPVDAPVAAEPVAADTSASDAAAAASADEAAAAAADVAAEAAAAAEAAQ